jgi:adenylate cyclase
LNVQLIDTESGAHMWAERFDVDLGSSADARNELTGRLVCILSAKLTEDVNRRIETVPPQDWTPYDLVMQGRALASRPFSAANRYDAMSCFEQALDRAPGAAGARIGMAGVGNILDRWSQSSEHDEARAEQLLIEILRDDDDSPEAHTYMGMLRRVQGRLSDARIELEIAIGLAPNNVGAIGQFGIVLAHLGQPEATIPQIERCLRLAPHDRNTPGNHAFLGFAS